MDIQTQLRNLRKRNFHPFIKYFGKKYFSSPIHKHYHDNFCKKDWDILLVADGCRLDTARKLLSSSYSVESILSPGSSSQEWLSSFKEMNCEDIVYVTANPFGSEIKLKEIIGENPFYQLYPVWDYGWDADLRTVPANMVNDSLLDAQDEYPEKRIIAHYMQPHYPFIGEKQVKGGGWNKEVTGDNSDLNIWKKLKLGLVELEDVREAYESNFEYLMSNINNILPKLEGKTVLTADHGNLLGEFGMYGHPSNIYLKELVEVPWVELRD